MKKLIQILLLSLAFAPLVRDSSVFFPDSAGKIFFVRIILMFASIIFLLGFIFIKNLREEIVNKLVSFFRQPLFLAVLAFTILFITSAIFAVDSYTAFWGDVQRGEGVVGIVFFLSFFIFSLLVFDKKDWLWFLKLSVITSFILLGKEFLDFFAGLERPGSFIGNPTFLAGHLIFSIVSALLVFNEEKNKFWRYFSAGVLALSLSGIFITETRGAILGCLLGAVAVLLYCVFKGEGIKYKNLSFKKASMIILLAFFLLSGVFFLTRDAGFWQKIPGLARVAIISGEDISTRTRLFSIQSSLESVVPLDNGLKKLLLGWGPNNYILAFGKYYNLEQYKYEREWFDRSHNKLLDVLVMNGVLGLLAYLSIWFFYFRYIFQRREFSFETFGLIFYGVSFLIHLLFVFDHISTSIPFFTILSLIIFKSLPEPVQVREAPELKQKTIFFGAVFSLFTLFLCFTFFRGDLIAYMQMKRYLFFKNNAESTSLLPEINTVFSPFTIAQTIIRRDLLTEYLLDRDTSSGSMGTLFETAISKADEYMERMPNDFRFAGAVASVYSTKGNRDQEPVLIKKGEEYFRKALAFSPSRPDYKYGLALNLAYQDKYNESSKILNEVIEVDVELADSYYYYGFIFSFEGEKKYTNSFDYLEKSFTMKPDLILNNKQEIIDLYTNFIKYFYQIRDKNRFIKTAERLIENNFVQSIALSNMVQYLEQQGQWPRVEFK